MISLKSVLLYCLLATFLFLFLLLYILGAIRYITDFEENTCDMTYMFEYPQYVRISLDEDLDNKFPRYGLYAYGEGFVTEKLRKMQFSGIPVLFIPGNAGSYEQVRSIASVSLRKSLKDRTPFHFDFFSLSFGKDYSALYGGVLMEEAVYTSHCIKKILSLYKGNVNNVALIGHSMGGNIAIGALTLTPNANISVARVIINLSTPYTPSVVLDNAFANYYYDLKKKRSEIKNSGINVISISGGPRDILIPASQSLDTVADINVLSTHIPDVWRPIDHLCILWCKQLVLSIVRSLFDSVDTNAKPPKINAQPDRRLEAFSYHFLHRTSGKRLYHYKEKIKFDMNGEWIEDIRNQYTWESSASDRKRTFPVYLMIRLIDFREHLTIETINLETKDWLFICSASTLWGYSRVCEWGWNLTNQTRMTPDYSHRLKKVVDLDMNEMKYSGMSHIIIAIAPNDLDNHVIVNVDTYSNERRTLNIKDSLPFFKKLFNFGTSNHIDYSAGQVRTYINLNRINVVNVELKKVKCDDTKESGQATVELLESSYPGATQFVFLSEVDNGPKTIRIQTRSRYNNVTATLRMTLDPKCAYSFNIEEGGLIDRISCLVRDRWSVLYNITISLLLLIISIRLDNGKEMIPTLIVTIASSIYYGLTFESCVCLAIICVFAISTCCSVIFLGSVAHGIAVRFLARAIAFSTTWADWLLGGLNQLPFFTAFLILSLIPVTCGALAMVITVFFYFLKLTRMYEDYLEELLMSCIQHFQLFRRSARTSEDNSEENECSTRQKILNHLILFLLWSFTSISALPSVFVWARNFSYDNKLTTEDPALLSSWIILTACSTLELAKISSKKSDKSTSFLANVLRFFGWVTLSTAAAPCPSFYQCYIPLLVACCVMLISYHSVFTEKTNA